MKWTFKKIFTGFRILNVKDGISIEIGDHGAEITTRKGSFRLSKKEMYRIGCIFMLLGDENGYFGDDIKVVGQPKTPIFNGMTLEEYHEQRHTN